MFVEKYLSLWGVKGFILDRYFSTSNSQLFFINTEKGKYVLKSRNYKKENEIKSLLYVNDYIKLSSLILPFERNLNGDDFLIDNQYKRLITITSKADVSLNSRYILALNNYEVVIGEALAELHKLMRSIPINNYKSKLVWPNEFIDFNYLNFSNFVSKDLMGIYYSALENRSLIDNLTRQWIHGDFRVNNLVLNYNDGFRRLKIIDFDNVSIFPRVYEVVRAFMCTIINDKFPRDIFFLFSKYLDAYENVFPLSLIERELLIKVYIWVGLNNVLRRVYINGCLKPYDKLVLKRCNYIAVVNKFYSKDV
ncbi:phosphotransferase [Acinetobacter baumannii]|nr:phosphotransferase [Acinetobacter baumannii]